MAARGLVLAIVLILTAYPEQSLRDSITAQTSVSVRSNSQATEKIPVSRDSYVGDETCRSCHGDKVKTFFGTAHHLTSRQASADSIAGTFGSDANVLKTSNPGLFFRMDKKDDDFFQTAIWGTPPYTTTRTEPIDLVIGSGRKGQTYLYWTGDRLFQLPVSYWIELGQWVNSPGYRDGVANFNRPVISRCLECHASYADSLEGPQPNNRYKMTSVVLGISCERCHGPGREHVARHRSGSTDISARWIVNPARLPRDREVEVCAQCHAGHGKPLAAPFSYVSGERLDAYLELDRPDPKSKIDVHGNQVALLQRSRCYQSSAKMTCSTCHNVHESQRDAAAFSSRCLACHTNKNCGMYSKMGDKIALNCIDCHMPVQQSNAIVSDSNGKQISAQVRNHWIKVYPVSEIPGMRESGGQGRVDGE
jgi:hypothetical protein